MTVTPDMAERHARQLARYAELALTLAEDVHGAALAAPEPDQKARCAEAFHRLGRALRQSIAWEAKLARDQARDLKAAEADAAEASAKRVRRRQDQVQAEVERRIYREIDPSQAHVWLADFTERLDEEVLEDGFLDEPLETQVDRLAADLGLTGETNHEYVPRACRSRHPGPRWRPGDITRMFPGLGDDEDDEDDEAGEDEADEDEAQEDEEDEAADEPERASPAAPPPPTEERAPEPEPPPGPPDPEPDIPKPYIPPWEINPYARYPGGSGY